MKQKKDSQFYHFIKMVVIWFLATIFAYALYESHLRYENILMIYVVGIMLLIIETNTFWGLVSSFLFVFTENYLFVEPRGTFSLRDPNCLFSSIIFIFVAIIMGILMNRLQRTLFSSKQREEMTDMLYQIGKGYLNLVSTEQIIRYSENALEEITEEKIDIILKEDIISSKNTALKWCLDNSTPCGFGEASYSDEKYKYIPIKNDSRTLGVVRIHCTKGYLTEDVRQLLETVLTQIDLALERSFMNVSDEQNKLLSAKEKYRSSLLRGISNDLYDPLLKMAESTRDISKSLVDIAGEKEKNLLKSMDKNISWMLNRIEGLRCMLAIQDGTRMIEKMNIDSTDILRQAVNRAELFKGNHMLDVKKSDKICFVSVDSQLMTLALSSLLCNAYKYTPEKAYISISVASDKTRVFFEISDDGGGVDASILKEVFDSIYSESDDSDASKYGDAGFGITVCRTIVEAHGGILTAKDNNMGGTTFQIILGTSDADASDLVLADYAEMPEEFTDYE